MGGLVDLMTGGGAGGRPAAPGALATPQAEDAEQERREEDLQPDDQQLEGDDRELVVAERAEAVVDPLDHDHERGDEAREDDRAAEQQAVLEPEARPHPSNQASFSPMK